MFLLISGHQHCTIYLPGIEVSLPNHIYHAGLLVGAIFRQYQITYQDCNKIYKLGDLYLANLRISNYCLALIVYIQLIS